MQHPIQSTFSDWVQQATGFLQRSPGSRSIFYFGTAAVMFEVVGHLQKSPTEYEVVHLHLAVLPLGAAFTYACVCLRPEDRARWNRVPLRQGFGQALQGVGLGTAAFLAWLGIAKAKQWVSAPAWGWEETPLPAVLRSAALLGVGHLAVAWNEEMVFRGYGFDTVRTALGQGKAVAVLIPGFALYHGLDRQQVLGMLAGGTTLMLLRLHSDALWLPVGYHWAWNVLQTAVFGAPDAAPSIRPLQVHGPERWMGKPGEPEPGLLSTLLHVVMAVIVWLWMRRNGTRRG